MTQSKDNLIEKIRKLFALADPERGGTEAEVMVAMERAKSLMAKHNLSMAEVAVADDAVGKMPEGPHIIEMVGLTRKHCVVLRKWEMWLAAVVDQICGTNHFYRANRHRISSLQRCVLIWAGDETDCHVAAALWPILRKSILAQSKERLGPGYRPIHRNYCEGFVVRLFERAKAAKAQDLTAQQEQTLALVVRSKADALATYVAGLGLRTTRESRSGAQHSEAHEMGYADGEHMSLSTNGLKGDA